MKSIKNVCKNVNKRSGMAIFGIEHPDNNGEVSCYQLGRYVSYNDVILIIFAFPIHERHPTVLHFEVKVSIFCAFVADCFLVTAPFFWKNMPDAFGHFFEQVGIFFIKISHFLAIFVEIFVSLPLDAIHAFMTIRKNNFRVVRTTLS